MSTTLCVLSIALALIGPWLAITYLLLMLSFGEFREGATVVDTLRRALWLVLAGVFGTVWFITRQVWGQVREVINLCQSPAMPQAGQGDRSTS
jgi:hypothetical protein